MESRIIMMMFCLLYACTGYASSLNIPFIENNGQYSYKHGDDLLFSAKAGLTTYYFTKNRVCIVTTNHNRVERIDLVFDNTLPNTELVGTNISPYYVNHYTTTGKYELLHAFERIQYKNLYPNIDVTFTCINNTLSILYSLKKGATPTAINLHYESPNVSISELTPSSIKFLCETTTLQLTSGNSTSDNSLLFSTQNNVILSTLDNNITVTTSNKEHTVQPLEILLSLTTMSTYTGGNNADSTTCAVKDVNNGMIVCGVTNSNNLPTTSGVFQQSTQGGKDAFVTKFDANGTMVWSTYFGGNGDDVAYKVACTTNTIAIVGSTTTQTNFATSGTIQTTHGGDKDAFVATLSSNNGTRKACTYYGGTKGDVLYGVTFDKSNNIIACGTTQSTNISMTTHQTEYHGGKSDAFMIKLNTDVTQKLWSTYYGGILEEEGISIASLNDGTIIMCGTTTTPFIDVDISENVTEGISEFGQTDVFLTKFSQDGKRIWGRYYGGATIDVSTDIIISNENIYLCGYTNSSNTGAQYIATSGTVQNNKAGGYDGFIARFDPANGTRIWGTYNGGEGDDRCTALSPMANGDVYVCGYTNSGAFPIVASDQKKVAGGYDAFLGYYISNGTKLLASALVGGSKDDYAAGIARMNDGTILFCGTTNSTDFPTLNAAQGSNAGSYDMFIVKFIDLTILDVHETDNTMGVSVAPNPTNGIITVSHSEITSPTTVTVSSVLGERIYTIESNLGSQQTTINTSELASGMYITTLTSATGVSTITFVKQ